MNQDSTTTAIHQKWCTDITYIYTKKYGWTYPTSVTDWLNKKSFGYASNVSITSELARKTVNNACLNVKGAESILLHNDLRTQYTSHAFEKCLKENWILHSFSRKGTHYNNACIESFHSILKKEKVNQTEYSHFEIAKQSLFEYIESWYNRKQIHSFINYLTLQSTHNIS